MKDKIKINIIIPFIYRVGGVKLIFEYANRLTDLGHDVVIYSPLYPYNSYMGKIAVVNTLKRFYRLFKQLISQKANISKFKEIKFKIKQVPFITDFFVRDADISVATAWATAYSVNNFSPKKGKKFYFVQDYENWDSNVEYVDKTYLLHLNIISTCKYLSRLLLDKFDVKSDIIFNGIDLSLFYREGDINAEPLNILFIDSGMKRKNSTLSIETIKKLKPKYERLNFAAFGHKKFHAMPDYITFHENPSDENIRKLYSEADIFLCTSLEEGFATPPAEAMACKCAVVTNIVGAVEEYSTHMVSAMHVIPGDEDGFFNSVCYLIDNKEKWREISLAGYRDAVEILDCWDDSTKKLENLFLSTIK